MQDAKSLNIQIKLIEEDNVILVKCPGFRTEIFMPAIVGDRLSIINIVPKRRCRCISTNFILAKQTDAWHETTNQTISEWCLSADFSAVENLKPQQILLASTPDQMRCAPAQRPATRRSLNFENAINSKAIPSMQMLKGVLSNSINLHHPNERILDNNISPISRLGSDQHFEYNSNSFQSIPRGSLSDMEFPENPNAEDILGLGDNTISNFNAHLNDPPKWRKVLTPLRTYSRRKHTPNNLSKFNRIQIKPHYLKNPTVGIKGETAVMGILVKRVKTRISPKSFKSQFHYKSAAELRLKFHQELRTREHKMHEKTAFELLTTPTLFCSENLKQQFYERCTYKFSSTYARYKNLACHK